MRSPPKCQKPLGFSGKLASADDGARDLVAPALRLAGPVMQKWGNFRMEQ